LTWEQVGNDKGRDYEILKCEEWIAEAKLVPRVYIELLYEEINKYVNEKKAMNISKLSDVRLLAKKSIQKENILKNATFVSKIKATVDFYRYEAADGSDGSDWKLKFKKNKMFSEFKNKMLPIINLENLEYRYVRMALTQLSRFGNNVLWSNAYAIYFKVTEINGEIYNIKVDLEAGAHLYLYIDLIEVRYHIEYTNDNNKEKVNYILFGEQDENIITDRTPHKIINAVLTKFKFKKPLKFTSNDTYNFIGTEGDYYLTLYKYAGNHFLTIENIT
jgi:hypothetical protein